MIIQFSSSKEFEQLLDALASEITHASIQFKLLQDIQYAYADYKKVFVESRTFWGITQTALLEATLSNLCKVYDTHSKALSLSNLLETIKANIDMFDNVKFKLRQKNNPFVESLAQTARRPDIRELDEDIAFTNPEKNALVQNLLVWRNNLISHRAASHIIDQKEISKDFPLTYGEISQLLDKALATMNKYDNLFRANRHSDVISGHEDYMYILKAVDEKLKRYGLTEKIM
ncbi:hypothetical protein ACFLVP_02720 [Chloroflexota bacterium]